MSPIRAADPVSGSQEEEAAMTRRWISGGFRVFRQEFESPNPVTGQHDFEPAGAGILERIFLNLVLTAFNEGAAPARVTMAMVPPHPDGDFQHESDSGLGPGNISSGQLSLQPGEFTSMEFQWRGSAAGTIAAFNLRELRRLTHLAYITVDSNQDIIPGGEIVRSRSYVDKSIFYMDVAASLVWYPRANLPPQRPPITAPPTTPPVARS